MPNYPYAFLCINVLGDRSETYDVLAVQDGSGAQVEVNFETRECAEAFLDFFVTAGWRIEQPFCNVII